MSMNFMDFQQELLETTQQAKEYSLMYLEARKESSECLNKLQVLIYKSGLHTSKKSIENKISELLAHKELGAEAKLVNEKMNINTSTYKGLECVIKAYLAHASALQSIMKNQVAGEISEAMQTKYSNN